LFDFQKQRGVYLNKSFYLEKLRVSYFEKSASISSLEKILILTLFLDASLNSCVQSVMQESAPVSDWWLH